MFSYYGGKSKVVKKYPTPTRDTIIEPFAGSARYALLYPDRNVILNDKYKVISDIWDFLIHASESDILSIPNLNEGDNLNDFNLSPVLKSLMGFMVNRGVPYPHYVYTKWPAQSNEIQRVKKRILSYLPKIRHWKISNVSYSDMDNIDATWYIDPPYQKGGERYVENSLDYDHLSAWCRSRSGQVIVCENSSATWMPFKPLVTLHGQKRKTQEVIWTNSMEVV